MLILTRRIGEAIFIGDNIEVRVISHKGGQLRVGVNAPKDIPILRDNIKVSHAKTKKETNSLL